MGSSHTRRPKGDGSLFQTSTGTWRGYVTATDPATGRRTRRWASGRTRAAAVAKLADLRMAAQGGRHSTTETTGAYLTRWLPGMASQVSARTHVEYASIVRRHLIPTVGHVRLGDLSHRHVEAMTDRLVDEGLSGLTARHARAVLRRALTDAQRDGLVTVNAAGLAIPPSHVAPEMRALEAEEAARFLAATTDHRDGPLYALALTTGLRQGELLGLAWSDIAADGRSLVVQRSLHRPQRGAPVLGRPKTGRSRRRVGLSAIGREALDRQRALQDADRDRTGTAWQDGLGLVFTDPLGRPLRADGVSARFRAAADAAGLRGVRFHDLRHSYASILIASGRPLIAVSEAMGHSGIGITADVYGHLTQDSRTDLARALDQALASADPTR